MEKCYHCGSSYQVQEAYCSFGQGLPHCSEHYDKCDICGVAYCNLGEVELAVNDDGNYVCRVCTEQPQQEHIEHSHH